MPLRRRHRHVPPLSRTQEDELEPRPVLPPVRVRAGSGGRLGLPLLTPRLSELPGRYSYLRYTPPGSSFGHEDDVARTCDGLKVGLATVAYDAPGHVLVIRYLLEIYAPLDRVWLVALDSIYDVWNPVQRYQATKDAIHKPVTLPPPPRGLHRYFPELRIPRSLELTALPLRRRDARNITERMTSIVYGSSLPSDAFEVRTRQVMRDASRDADDPAPIPSLSTPARGFRDSGSGADRDRTRNKITATQYLIEDTYKGSLMETYVRQVLGTTHPRWDEEYRWQTDLVRCVKCIGRDVKRRCERNYEVHVL